MMTAVQLRKVIQEIDAEAGHGNAYEVKVRTTHNCYWGAIHSPNLDSSTVRVDQTVADKTEPTWIAIHTIESVALSHVA